MTERHRKRKRPLLAVLAVILVAAALAAGAWIILDRAGRDELEGLWTSDGVTDYQFDGEGLGALILPSSKYTFRYQLDGGKLSIDFDDDRATDAEYTVSTGEDTLELVMEEDSKETVHITLYRKE